MGPLLCMKLDCILARWSLVFPCRSWRRADRDKSALPLLQNRPHYRWLHGGLTVNLKAPGSYMNLKIFYVVLKLPFWPCKQAKLYAEQQYFAFESLILECNKWSVNHNDCFTVCLTGGLMVRPYNNLEDMQSSIRTFIIMTSGDTQRDIGKRSDSFESSLGLFPSILIHAMKAKQWHWYLFQRIEEASQRA